MRLKAHGGAPQVSCYNASESPGLVFSIQNSLASMTMSFGTSSPSSQAAPPSSVGTQWVRAALRVGTCLCTVCSCALPSSPVIKWLSNKCKRNLRSSGASRERGKAWRELIIGMNRMGTPGPGGLCRGRMDVP